MAIVLDSLQTLPDGTNLIRYHLLEDNYQLIKPVERFLRFKQLAGAAIGTIKTYAEKLKAFWQYLDLKQMEWQDFTEKHLAEFGYWYLTGGILLDGRSLPDENELHSARSRKTVNLAITAIVQFYDFHTTNANLEDKNLREYKLPLRTQPRGMLTGHIKQSPVGIKKVKYFEPEKFPGCLSADQIRTMIKACRTARDKLIIWLLADTGMRKGELLGLHWGDIDWKARTLAIVRRDNPNHAYAKGQPRVLSIADLMREAEFCSILSKYADEEYPHDIVKAYGHNMVFVVLHQGASSYGQPLEPQNLNKLLHRLKEKTEINIERVYPHLLRHTFASHNIHEGSKKGKGKEEIAKTVQRQLGHKSIATTLDIYDHSFSEAELMKSIERLMK